MRPVAEIMYIDFMTLAMDQLVNQAGEVSIARSRLEGELRSLTGALSELSGNIARLRAQLRARGTLVVGLQCAFACLTGGIKRRK